MSAEDWPEIGEDNFNDSKSPTDIIPKDRDEKMNRQFKQKTELLVPSVAVPEKVVICIDTSNDLSLGYSCTFSNQTSIDPPTIMNDALRVFFINKLALAKDTMIAVVSINKPSKIELISGFTSDVKQLVKSLSEVKYSSNEEGDSRHMPDYDVTEIFSTMFADILGLGPANIQSKQVPPEFLVRVILIYNNSYTVPKMNEVDKFHAKFLISPYHIFDIVYMHEAQSDFNRVEKIYEQFSKLVSPRSYLLECSRNVTLVFNTFAKLLAHPYQRVSQEELEF